MSDKERYEAAREILGEHATSGEICNLAGWMMIRDALKESADKFFENVLTGGTWSTGLHAVIKSFKQ